MAERIYRLFPEEDANTNEQERRKEQPERRRASPIREIKRLTDADIERLFEGNKDEPSQGYVHLYRGTPEKWKQPKLSNEQRQQLVDESDRMIQEQLEAMQSGQKGRFNNGRFHEIKTQLDSEGNQRFTESPEVAMRYMGPKGELIRIEVDGKELSKYRQASGSLSARGKHRLEDTTNFEVPREWFLEENKE